MPSTLTHYFFASDFLKSITDKKDFLINNEDCFLLGTQGPDPLFFFGLLPFNGLHLFEANKKYGGQLHKSDGKRLFRLMINETKDISNLEEKNMFLAFTYGQFAHYILDSTVHPYVYYFSGFDDGGHLSGKYHYLHPHFEARIDSSLVCLRNESEELINKPYQVIAIDDKKLDVISKHFDNVLRTYFEKKIADNIYKSAILNMRACLRFTNGISAFKTKLLGKGRVGALHIPFKTNHNVLNENHLAWQDPYTGKSSVMSFNELYDLAIRKLKGNYCSLSNELLFKDIDLLLDGLTYSGIPLGETLKYKDVKGVLLSEKVTEN